MADPGRPRQLPFSVVAKPTGAACNLDCRYCFFLSKDSLYDPLGSQRMSEQALEQYLRAFLDGQPDGDVQLVWQGGEPTLHGLDFFQRAVDLADRLRRPRQRVSHAFQTNGILVDDEWAAFLAANHFLVGLSIDGPEPLHDAYRVNRAGRGSHAQVERAWRTLQRHGVDTNILCTVHAANGDHGLAVYRYFRDELGATFLQFIPIVERVPAGMAQVAEDGWHAEDGSWVLYRQHGSAVTSRTVTPAQWGAFLTAVFDEWARHDVGTVYVQDIEVMVGNLFGRPSLCVHAPECGTALAVDHRGDVYACDHYVEPAYRRGNCATDSFADILLSPAQREFGGAKHAALTDQCRRCDVRWACHGGCPKDRFVLSDDGQPGQNYLCAGYQAFFRHTTPTVAGIGALLRAGRPAADIMATPGRSGG